jgi:hypothetical protein
VKVALTWRAPAMCLGSGNIQTPQAVQRRDEQTSAGAGQATETRAAEQSRANSRGGHANPPMLLAFYGSCTYHKNA